MRKKCRSCKKELPKTAFHAQQDNKDGLQTRCKSCSRAVYAAYYASNKTRMRAQCKLYQQGHPEKVAVYARRYRSKYPEKRRANLIVHHAVSSGLLIASCTCADCGTSGKCDAHHENYRKPLEVVWLCRVCHSARHAKDKNV